MRNSSPRPVIESSRRQEILLVCNRERGRSRTAAELYAGNPAPEIRYAGVHSTADRKLGREDLLWAEPIFVKPGLLARSEPEHSLALGAGFPFSCRRGDLNPTGLAQQILRLQRLPCGHVGAGRITRAPVFTSLPPTTS